MCPRCGGVIPGRGIMHAYPHLFPICECHKEIQEAHRRKMRKLTGRRIGGRVRKIQFDPFDLWE